MILILGGGAAGLAAARTLHAAGAEFQLLEKSERLGGRLRTDQVDGFLLDHGFQIFLTAYPEAKRLLDYERLALRSFQSGARIREGERWHILRNPLKEGITALSSVLSGIGSPLDKVHLLQLAAAVSTLSDGIIFQQPATTTLRFLRDYGFSERIINLFFRPFFGGVFLDRELETSSNLLRFLFKQFLTTAAALPAAGIQGISDELARPLPAASIRLNTPVTRLVDSHTVLLASGEQLTAEAIILATDAVTTAQLLGQDPLPATGWHATTVTYYAAPASPQAADRLLALNPDRRSLLHNVSVPSDVQPSYAPAGQSLISVSSHGAAALALSDEALDSHLRQELSRWYGTTTVATWRRLRTYRLPYALPHFGPAGQPSVPAPVRPGLWLAGDHMAYPALNAALQSGRRVAEAILAAERL